MANIFAIDNGTISCVVETGFEYTEQYAVTRAEFTAQYPSLDISAIRALAYEPSRSLYHVTDANHNVTALASPSENAVMDYVSNNFDAIKAWMRSVEEAAQAEPQA